MPALCVWLPERLVNMDKPRIVVSALLERLNHGKRELFVQTRFKPESSPTYLNTLEIPAGGVDAYENVYDALKREVKEETGLDIINIIGDDSTGLLENRTGDKSMAFRPFICQQVTETNGGLPWYGFVFLCEVSGEIKMQIEEAKDPRWMDLTELKLFLEQQPENVFSLQYATLKKYVEERAESSK